MVFIGTAIETCNGLKKGTKYNLFGAAGREYKGVIDKNKGVLEPWSNASKRSINWAPNF